MPSKLDEFLNGKKDGKTDKDKLGRLVLESNKPFTHWTFDNSKKYFIDADDQEEFFRLYCDALRNSIPQYLTERSTPISMLRVDLDFKFEGEVEKHKHTKQEVESFVNAYLAEVGKYLELPPSVPVYVLEKDYPTYSPAKKLSSSGVHIQVPSVKTRAAVNSAVRRILLKRMGEFFPSLQIEDEKKWESIYDKSALTNNGNWPVLGSKKKDEGSLSYRIKYVLNCDDASVPEVVSPELLKLFTVRSPPEEETPLTEFGKTNINIAQPTERSESSSRGRPSVRQNQPGSRSSSPGRNYVEPLSEQMRDYYARHTDNLAECRYKNYQDWVAVGQCLKNIHPDLEDVWMDFSAKAGDSVYNPREAISKWNSFNFRTDGPKLSIGSLRHWSREDNEDEYKKIEESNIDRLIDIAANTGREYDMARVVYSMFRDDFKCSNYEKSDWYEFVGHIWKNRPRGVTLLCRLSSDVAERFLLKEEKEIVNLRLLGNCEHDKEPNPECEVCKAKRMKKVYNTMYTKLGQTKFKDNVMKECKELFLDSEFENKIDSNKYLLAFTNGVYDLQQHIFRPGKSDDYITKTTGIDFNSELKYYEFKAWPEVELFLRNILPRENVRKYYLKHIASCLAGAEGSQRFHILTGSGSNGKSLFTNLICKAFGTYSTKVPVSLFTQKRGKAGSASPELLKLKGCRFGSMAEPDEGEALSTGIVKELSGGEPMTGRDLYAGSKEMKDFILQIRFHLACNEKPKVTTNDGGTWRRLIVIDFPSKFVPNPDPKNPNEKPMDETVDFKVQTVEWAECFMAYLLHLYREGHGLRKLEAPSEVLEYTNEYKEESDSIARFIGDCLRARAEDEEIQPVSKQALAAAFQEWKRTNDVSKGSILELNARVSAQYGKYLKPGWTSFQLGSS